MMNTREIRLNNLRKIIEDRFGGIAGRCADALEIKRPQMSRWVTTSAKSRQGVSEDSAREIERKLGYPRGWLDLPPSLIPTGSKIIPVLVAQSDNPDLQEVRRVKFKLSAGVSGFVIEPEEGDSKPVFFRKFCHKNNCAAIDKQ